MHIAFFTNYYHPVVNGVVRSVASFRDVLMRQGHNVFVFAQADAAYQDNEPFIFRYPSLSLPLSGDISAAIPVSPFVDQLLPALKLDVIHTHHPVLLGQTAARKAAELELPLIFTFHTQYWEYTHYVPFPQEAIQDFLKNAVHKWLRDFMQKCQHIIIPSESMKEILVRNYGLEERYTVIPTGTDLAPYQCADWKSLRKEKGWEHETVLISVGRLAPEKNLDTLLRAFAKACSQYPDLRLVLIGDGNAKQDLESLASELGVAERVTFTGSLPFEDVPCYLKAADVFTFASITETQGLVTIEAMAAGLPVVAVDASGTRDIVEHGKQGFLVENDVDALAEGIKKLLSDPQQMKRFGNNALKKAKMFDVNELGKQLVSVYEQAIQDKKENLYVTLKAEEPPEQEAISPTQA
ncbi:MAG TPA: glycosyltransferase family 4 protein [Anaerolineales bacterium]|nr:glycosyltransferase family 4 protein [Anaerolineales bacterium]